MRRLVPVRSPEPPSPAPVQTALPTMPGTNGRTGRLGSSVARELGVALIAPGNLRLFEAAGLLTFKLFTDLEGVDPRESRKVVVRGSDPSEFLAAWIREWIDISRRERFVFCRFRVDAIEPHRIRGAAWGERIDPARHRLHRDPELVTLRHAHVTSCIADWRAELAFEIPEAPP